MHRIVRFHSSHFTSFHHSLPLRRRIVTRSAFGQPLFESHPHLLKSGQLTPGITAVEYHERRSRLAQALPDNAIAIVVASDIKYKSGAAFYEFYQDPSFLYLTGFKEPGAVAVIKRVQEDYSFHMFVRPKDVDAEQWDGARSGIAAAKDIFNADEASSITDAAKLLPDMMSNASAVYADTSQDKGHRSKLLSLIFGQQNALTPRKSSSIQPLRPLMNELRVIKSEDEIAAMRKHESETAIWAELEYGYRKRGLDGPAYLPVVAGGQNGLSIHYARNDQLLTSGEMVLVDAGGAYGGYMADITRTWPIDGTFTSAQRDLYQVVLDTQRHCIALCRQNADTSLDKLHEIATTGLSDGLQRLGFDVSGQALDILFPHHVGHHLGLDIHDAPGYPRSAPLKTGHCITIEPGIYVPDDEKWPKHFRGMAIRIEDSICVTEEHPLNLTTEAVKEVADIEALKH